MTRKCCMKRSVPHISNIFFGWVFCSEQNANAYNTSYSVCIVYIDTFTILNTMIIGVWYNFYLHKFNVYNLWFAHVYVHVCECPKWRTGVKKKDRIRIEIAATKFSKLSYAKQFMQDENTMEKCMQLNSKTKANSQIENERWRKRE